jgi:tRNA (adenine57-N1/adenine58-N1)-methyltransferase
MSKAVSESDSVVLVNKKGKKIILKIENKIRKIKGLGVYNSGELVGKRYYSEVEIGSKSYTLMEPSFADKISAIERKAQIIIPKDGMFILYYCDIKPKDLVIEGGTGSGALTMLLANYVRPKGKVISYDMRADHLKVAKKNLMEADLLDYVDLKKGDVTQKISENNVDSVVLDIPNPQDALENVYKALRLGGHVGIYTPSINQFEITVRAMENFGFGEIITLETLQREMIVGSRGVRPSFDSLGHTGYITFARKII